MLALGREHKAAFDRDDEGAMGVIEGRVHDVAQRYGFPVRNACLFCASYWPDE